MTFIIKDWDLHYEKADTRKCKEMKWVAIPTDTADKKYRRITKMKDGAELFGMWLAILEVASKMPKRGVLSDKDGDLSFDDMELIGGFPAKAYEKALNTLSSPEIGWVINDNCGIFEEITNSGDHPDNIPKLQDVILTTGQDITRQDKTGQDNTKTIFGDFRILFPGTKKGLEVEFENFKSRNKNFKEIVYLLNPAIKKEIDHKQQLIESKVFCPSWKNLTTWINQKCWEQEFGEIIIQPQNLSHRERDELAFKQSLEKTERMLHASKLREFRPREIGNLSESNRNDVDSEESGYIGNSLGQEM